MTIKKEMEKCAYVYSQKRIVRNSSTLNCKKIRIWALISIFDYLSMQTHFVALDIMQIFYSDVYYV